MDYIKNKKREAIASLLLIIALGQSALAQNKNRVDLNNTNQYKNRVDLNNTNQWYGGLGISSVNVTCKDNCEDITFGVIGKVGYDFNDYIGVEGRVVKTFIEYEQSKVKHYGIFAKPMYPITDKLDIYGLLGYAHTKVGNIKNYNGSGLSWGLGVNYFFENSDEERLDKIKELKKRYREKKIHTKKEKERFQKRLNKLIDNDDNDFGLFLEYQSLIEKSNAPDIHGFHLGLLYRF